MLQPGQQASVRGGTYTQDLMASRAGTASAPMRATVPVAKYTLTDQAASAWSETNDADPRSRPQGAGR